MTERIARALAAAGGLSDWRVVETKKNGYERYFVKTELECSREVDTVEYRVTAYVDSTKDGEKVRGDSSFMVHPTMDDAELAAAAKRAVFAASKVANKPYELPGPGAARVSLPDAGCEGRDPAALLETARKALFEADGRDGATVNSLEIFLTRVETRIRNSRGVDASWTTWKGFTEYVVNAPGPKGEIELYGSLKFGSMDPKRLSRAVAEKLSQARDRAQAVPTPDIKGVPILLSCDNAGELFNYFFANCSALGVFQKISPFAVGSSAQGDAVSGDRISMGAEAVIAGHPESAPFDQDGLPISSFACVSAGEVRGFFGPKRYCGYLGIPETGDYALFSVAPGSARAAELRSRPHFEPVVFSDFFADPATGDFGGEVRLGYWFDGAKRIPVTGGSVTGSLLEARGSLRASSELFVGKFGSHPEVVLVPKANVTPGA